MASGHGFPRNVFYSFFFLLFALDEIVKSVTLHRASLHFLPGSTFIVYRSRRLEKRFNSYVLERVIFS